MRGESLTQTVGIHSQIEVGQPNQPYRRTKIEQEAEFMNKGREPHPTYPKQCPIAGKEILCNKPVASSNPEAGKTRQQAHTHDPEEGKLLDNIH